MLHLVEGLVALQLHVQLRQVALLAVRHRPLVVLYLELGLLLLALFALGRRVLRWCLFSLCRLLLLLLSLFGLGELEVLKIVLLQLLLLVLELEGGNGDHFTDLLFNQEKLV